MKFQFRDLKLRKPKFSFTHNNYMKTSLGLRFCTPLTCSGITMMKIFLSLSDRICLTKAQPAPIKTIVTNSRVPFILWGKSQKKCVIKIYWLQYSLKFEEKKLKMLQDGFRIDFSQQLAVCQNRFFSIVWRIYSRCYQFL